MPKEKTALKDMAIDTQERQFIRLIAAANHAGIPDARGWLIEEANKRGVTVMVTHQDDGTTGYVVGGYTDQIHEELNTLIARFDQDEEAERLLKENGKQITEAKPEFPPAVVEAEVIDMTQVCELLDITPKKDESDEAKLCEWLVTVIRTAETQIDEIHERAGKEIAGRLKGIEMLLTRYKPTLKNYCLQEIAKQKGKQKKQVPFFLGTVFFTKTGGNPKLDPFMGKEDLQKWGESCIEEGMDDAELEARGISIAVKVDATKAKSWAKANNQPPPPGFKVEPADEYGKMEIGGALAWTMKKSRALYSDQLKPLFITTYDPEEDDA